MMKVVHVKLLPIVYLFLSIALFQSCGEEECPKGIAGPNCEADCIESIIGVWNVTTIDPAFCTLSTYNFETRPSDSFISVTLIDETRLLTGEGLLDSDCLSMTYTVSEGGTIVNGSISFDGNRLTDMSDLGCLFTAIKQ